MSESACGSFANRAQTYFGHPTRAGSPFACSRARKLGLPSRYRLLWPFSSTQQVIIVLYLNDEATLRKDGSKADVYDVFKRFVREGAIGSDYGANREQWLTANAQADI